MSEKRKLIDEMIAMQKKFIEHEREHGMDQEKYWLDDKNHPLSGYKDSYEALATKVVDLAHKQKGSKR